MTLPIVVVSGLPRSGTSLMMQMLEAGGVPQLIDGVRAPDEDNPRGYFEFEPVKAIGSDASFLDAAPGRAIKIVAPLLRFLPSTFEYRVLMMEREMGEVLASQASMLERSSPLAAARGGGPDAGVMASAFESVMERVDAFVADSPNINLIHISHADTLADPGGVAGHVARYLAPLGGDFDVTAKIDRMAAVVSPELYRAKLLAEG